MPRAFPFYVVAAFSKGPFQGNPASVVFIDDKLETDTLMKIAANLNQPMASIVGPQIPSADEKVAAFSIRWFTATSHEVDLCGHATMAAARAVFERRLVEDSVEVIEFHTATGGVMKARKVGADAIEIRLPTGAVAEVPSAEIPKVTAALAKGFGRDVAIKYIGAGGKGFESYLVVELDEQEDLGKCTVDVNAFSETGYGVNVITTDSSDGDALFVSRMFAPLFHSPPFSEDAVCGSAHCLLAPYWYKKKGLVSNEFSAKQVSPRGGDLGLVLDQEAGTVGIQGTTFVVAGGEIYV
ncbi:hypothetical protein B0H17DRAFT_1211099 [Mycena rosella]|uniref:Diaminopimelate epimerase-like protein n=1 Tax=Mycena rosella TaxID=1033263 RepID=A0AAD7CUW4_MYCRO|nr:hypothetical protein B0H17DRAFT_1211099 [Mycena rosella]